MNKFMILGDANTKVTPPKLVYSESDFNEFRQNKVIKIG